MNMLQQRPVLAPRVRLRADSINGQPVLLYPEGVLVLNETAHAVAQRCDGSTIGEMVDELAREYEAEPSEIERDVCECVSDLLRRNLLVLRK